MDSHSYYFRDTAKLLAGFTKYHLHLCKQVFLAVVHSLSCVWFFLQPIGLQHTSLPYPSLSPKICSNSSSLSWWCHPTISYSVAPFSSCPQSFPTSVSFTDGIGWHRMVLELQLQHQSIQWIFRVDFLYDWLVWSPCCYKGLSRIFSNTTVQKYPFFYAQPSLWSNSHICDYWKNRSFDYMDFIW